ncbi:DUF1697 domain-containing protein [Aldersonia sp. NBC_00410]|uniref:DUF1697 domain-containing protein n=1 Tax=Aldersonia sp. NBC_00410 TaxID=2975954 RepID=UPI0022569B03|nr:DUF1697 domain-containing protein [Aldersonia sp. NBC_00410]MCX5046085.1 DUF1697 domain-containing protein [Aldersonia sp. NBC_00410]
MTRYAALLRGIAPSNPNMTNDKLRAVFDGLGFAKVTSVLASGNIVFGADEQDTALLETRIQEALQTELGIGGATIVRSHAELRALLDIDPFPGLTHGRSTYLIATFLRDGAQSDPGKLPAPESAGARIVGYDPAARALLAVVDNSEPGKASKFMALLERTYGTDITTRSWLTVQRIVTKLES